MQEALESNNITSVKVQSFSDRIVKIMTSTAVNNGNIKRKVASKRIQRSQPCKPWYNAECENKRKLFHAAKRCLKSNDNPELLMEYQNASREYKQCLKKAFQSYKREFNQKLRVLRSNNVKEYWNILNSNKSVQKRVKLMSI